MISVYYIRKGVARSTYMFTFTTAAIAIPECNDFVLLVYSVVFCSAVKAHYRPLSG